MGLLGAHVSISGGLEICFERGEKLGCEAIQIFSKNQKQWKASPLSDKECFVFKELYRQSSIQKTIVHDSYLINLASPDRDGLKKSRKAFLDECSRADRLGISYLVFHPGFHKGTGEKEGIKRIAESLNWIIQKERDNSVELLIETTSGQGSQIGYRFEQLADIILQVEEKNRLGVCFDTAHVFTAGYDLRTAEAYYRTMQLFDAIIGIEKLKVFHINDSKSEIGSRIDRHEHIGKGFIGMVPFRLLVQDVLFQNHPMILETPKGLHMDLVNLKRLRLLKGSKNKMTIQ